MASVDQITGAGVILTDPRTRRVLLVKGAATGKLSFPKGEKQPNETLLACARRECLEETGVLVRIPQDSHVVTFGTKAKRCYFVVDDPSCILSQKPYDTMKTEDTKEIQTVSWVSFERGKALCRSRVNHDVFAYFNNPKQAKFYRFEFPDLKAV